METNSLWGSGADLERLNWTFAITWCLVALVLVVGDRRFWAHRDPADSDAQVREADLTTVSRH